MTRRYGVGIAAVTLIASAALALPAFAQVNADIGVGASGNAGGAGIQMNASVTGGGQSQDDASGQGSQNDERNGSRMGGWQGGAPGMRIGVGPGVIGTVTAVNGTTLTVAGRPILTAATAAQPGQRPQMMATTTFTVDASSAAIYKNNSTSTLSSVAVNDRVYIGGTISGTNMTATFIRDGILGMMWRRPGNNEGGPGGVGNFPVQGNGQPVVAGTVSSVNGSTITITTSSDTSYTVDASNAAVMRGNSTTTLASVSTGDYVVVQGAVNGSSVTASSIIEGQAGAGAGPGSNPPAPHGGFMSAIAQFFRHLFGF